MFFFFFRMFCHFQTFLVMRTSSVGPNSRVQAEYLANRVAAGEASEDSLEEAASDFGVFWTSF